ncbi:MAG: hypothetical protein L3J41_11710 [Melioribacteraceae bacterium]|nr:hypothetical protein [Melioribacteraceae bacterium]
MKNLLTTVLILFGLFVNIVGQTEDIKKEAKELFKNSDYKRAIEILKQTEAKGTDDPEIYYLLGYYSHYLAYDSRPLLGHGLDYSNKVLEYLEKAIELSPNYYGDVYSLLGAEYGARASNSLRKGDAEEYINIYKEAYEKGLYPLWLIERGRNMLKSCDKNAILITGGDSESNPIRYLQLIENYRTDITVISYGFLNRPWYIEKLKNGFHGIYDNVPIGLSDEQILDMHPYKWDTLTIKIPISEKLKTEYELSADEMFEWEMVPNLLGERKNYLSADKAVLASIIETNKWERPIYFSIGCHPTFVSGLTDNFQLSGLINKLLPMETKGTKFSTNSQKIEDVLLNKNNIRYFKDVEKHNIPRNSGGLSNYYFVLYRLAIYYKEQNKVEKISEIADFIENNLLTDIFPHGVEVVDRIRKLEK